MKAIVRHAYGDVDQLQIEDINTPEPAPGEVLVRVMAFGLNRAELYMRKGLWGDVAAVSGIECVGSVAHDPSGELPSGQPVAALMGGMGRTINGSYAEFTCLARNNVIALKTSLSWPELAAIPESYATAWACLHQNLNIDNCHSLLVRGGTSALGQAAINIAADAGKHIIATTRATNRLTYLKAIGATDAVIDTPELSREIRANYPHGADAVLDIVGNTTVLDSLKIARKGGAVCYAGFLGGGEPLTFNPLTDLPPGVNLNFFASFMFGTPEFPLAEIPLQQIVDKVSENVYACKPANVFGFNEIQQAHALMESNKSCGKIVVVL